MGENFCSDNVTGACPEVMEAVLKANEISTMAYGNDEYTTRLSARLAEVFEHDVTVFPVTTGTAANALALAAISPRHGAVYCHHKAHINVDECGAPEFYTGGAKLVLIDGKDAKFCPQTLEEAIVGAGDVHHVQPASVSITQATELGTVYALDELASIAQVARRNELPVHMDGARLANALAHLGCDPAEATWKAGVDVLSLGGTKNGCLAAEAIVFFTPRWADALGYYRKRGGHLVSKMRFVSAQLCAYLEDELWLRNARRANAAATRLGCGLEQTPGCRLVSPVQANEVFAVLPERAAESLRGAGYSFSDWESAGPGAVRFVTAFSTTSQAIDALLSQLAQTSGQDSQ